VRVVVLADDLIWSTRLVGHVRATGADAVPARNLAALDRELPSADAVIVDLTAIAYDGIAAIRRATEAGRRVIAVGQHDDAELRRQALAAGAERFHPYRRLFEDGPATLARWLDTGLETPAR
jgi:DNA-binding NarL/FixJ family response regulator